MINPISKRSIIKNMARINFRTKKTFGQNFLLDKNIIDKIVSSASKKFRDAVIEIGPGFGALTLELAKNFRQVISIELDKKLFEFISQEMSELKNVTFINQDALKVNINDIVAHFDNPKNIVLCANLPYCITTPVLSKFLKSESIDQITVMIQKEAAERITAPLGTRNCGAISYFVRYYSNPKLNFTVSKNCFFPTPKVNSAVISLEKIKKRSCKNEDMLFKVLKSAFEKRRKNILNSIFSSLGLEETTVFNILKKCNLDKNLRAENLGLSDFINIAEMI